MHEATKHSNTPHQINNSNNTQHQGIKLKNGDDVLMK